MINLLSSSLIAALTFLSAQSTHVIEGQVNDNLGKAACGVRVCALAADFDPTQPNRTIPCGLSDEQGKFTIFVDKASRYRLVYDHSAQGYYSTYQPFFRQPSTPLPEVFLDNTDDRVSITFSMLPKNGRLVGKGVDSNTGLPVESMDFVMCHAANPEVCWRISAKSSNGNFSVPAPHVPFTVKVKAEGFDEWFGPNGDKKEAPISVAPETKAELTIFMKRSDAAAGKAVSDSEKSVGTHLPAPVLSSPANDSVFDVFPRVTKLKWEPVEGAVSYKVEVDFCTGGIRNRADCLNPQPLRLKNNPPMSGIVNTTYEFNFIGAQPGRWRVWAVDDQGREGFKSSWRRFVYLR